MEAAEEDMVEDVEATVVAEEDMAVEVVHQILEIGRVPVVATCVGLVVPSVIVVAHRIQIRMQQPPHNRLEEAAEEDVADMEEEEEESWASGNKSSSGDA